jgi:gliding motility-associated lipoprotein GldH
MKSIIALLAVFIMVTSCNSIDVYEKTNVFPQHEWKGNQLQSFTFNITDTISSYNLYVVFRHEMAYRYKNLWLNVKVKDPDSSYSFKREFTLANNKDWLGTGMDDIIDHRIIFNQAPIHLKKGVYTFILQQIMREDPLQYALNAGIRVEKVKP